MSQVIIVNNGDDTTSIIHPTPEALQTMMIEQIAAQSAPVGKQWRVTDISNLPQDRTYRMAWTDDNPGDTVGISMPRARTEQMDKIREKRNSNLVKLDAQQLIAESKVVSTSAIFILKQTQRDIPQNCQSQIDEAQTTSALSIIWPGELDQDE